MLTFDIYLPFLFFRISILLFLVFPRFFLFQSSTLSRTFSYFLRDESHLQYLNLLIYIFCFIILTDLTKLCRISCTNWFQACLKVNENIVFFKVIVSCIYSSYRVPTELWRKNMK